VDELTCDQARDADLVAAARGRDRRAMAVLLERHRGLLLGLCRRVLGDRDLAEDAAQEACVTALLNLDRLRDPERFGPWLGGIGLNTCRRWLRTRPQAAWSWEALPGGLLATAAPPAPDPHEQVELRQLGARVREAVAALPAGSATRSGGCTSPG
jgi:RNA polymerase sigma factor (sigma-70 family)